MMERRRSSWLAISSRWTILVVATLLIAVATLSIAAVGRAPLDAIQTAFYSRPVMLILRGISSGERPRGQLDDDAALEYARRLGYRGDVLDVASDASGDRSQMNQAIARIRQDRSITAIYGFSGGGYNAKQIWSALRPAERQRIDRVVVIGSPGIHKGDFSGSKNVVIKGDPPAGHLAGPRVLLDSLKPSS
jgi:hypothetical protein